MSLWSIESQCVGRLMWRLHELDPLRTIAALRLYVEANRLHLHQWLDTEQNNLVAELASQELNDIGYYTQTTASVERKIKVLIPTVAPSLVEIPGCGPLLAAKIVGETAEVNRFSSGDAFARYAGVGPVPHWSGRMPRRRRCNDLHPPSASPSLGPRSLLEDRAAVALTVRASRSATRC